MASASSLASRSARTSRSSWRVEKVIGEQPSTRGLGAGRMGPRHNCHPVNSLIKASMIVAPPIGATTRSNALRPISQRIARSCLLVTRGLRGGCHGGGDPPPPLSKYIGVLDSALLVSGLQAHPCRRTRPDDHRLCRAARCCTSNSLLTRTAVARTLDAEGCGVGPPRSTAIASIGVVIGVSRGPSGQGAGWHPARAGTPAIATVETVGSGLRPAPPPA